MQSVPLSAPTRAPNILIWSLAGLAALFLVWPVWRAFLPLEIWGNEGWNAYHADAAMRGAQLYPPPDGLVANNYPPLSYFLIGWLGRLFGDPLYVGRALSLLATLGIGAAAAAVVRQFGGTRAACLIAGFWFVATMARFFEYYVGMNEPQLLGLAVMSAGLVWFLKRHGEGRAVEPAVLLMVLAGFIKHNFITVPLVALIWLTLDNWRLGARAALVGGAAAALGLAICAWIFAPLFHCRHADAAHLSSGALSLHARAAPVHPARHGAVGCLGLGRAPQQIRTLHHADDRHRAAVMSHPEIRRRG